ncbi:transthyretin [Paramormyrops kingsleyae]|uniref:transthyretin n=1 Tax=Paramormyrops kingsleyae TaxID=1676925 RepID=UPI003B96C94C
MTRTALSLLAAITVLFCDATPEDYKTCPLMVKVLDAVSGLPASAVKLEAYRQTDNNWSLIQEGATDNTGEVHGLIEEKDFVPGLYKVVFQTKAYWKSKDQEAFHETAEVIFTAHGQGHRHYTLALLLSPYSYSTTAVVTNPQE